jgi:hypothetical protein
VISQENELQFCCIENQPLRHGRRYEPPRHSRFFHATNPLDLFICVFLSVCLSFTDFTGHYLGNGGKQFRCGLLSLRWLQLREMVLVLVQMRLASQSCGALLETLLEILENSEQTKTA